VTDALQKAEGPPLHSAEREDAPWLTEARALVALAAPLVLTQLAMMATLTTDVVLLGRYSRSALAAAAIGNTVFYMGWLVGGGPASAVSPMIAHILGARPGNRRGVRASVRMGLWAILFLSLPMMGVLWMAEPILLALGQQPDLAAQAGVFVGMLSWGLPFSLGFLVLRNVCAALGHPRVGLWVMLATILVNAGLGYTLIFGHFGAPRLGIAGSGIATALSSVFSCLAVTVFILRTPELAAYRMFHRFAQPVSEKLGEVFRLGLPIGLTMIFEAMLFNSMTLLMGTFGAAPLAAHQIALNFASVTFMAPLGIGMAATVRVGLAAGAHNRQGVRRAVWTAQGLAIGLMALCGLAMAVFGDRIAGFYISGRTPSDLSVIASASLFLKVAAAFQVFDAMQVVAAQALRGLKDARAPMVIAGVCYWLVGAPLCVWLALGMGLRGLGIWIGLAIALAVTAAALNGRLYVLTRRPST
jgi:MATE family multidrug resistance protein